MIDKNETQEKTDAEIANLVVTALLYSLIPILETVIEGIEGAKKTN